MVTDVITSTNEIAEAINLILLSVCHQHYCTSNQPISLKRVAMIWSTNGKN